MKALLCALLVRLHSRAWRERFGAEFSEAFLAAPLSPRDLIDCVASAIASRTRVRAPRVAEPAAPWRRPAALAFALVMSAVTGYANVIAPDITLPTSLLIVSCFTLSALVPRWAPAWAALLGISIPSSYVVGPAFGAPPEPAANVVLATMALVPAAIAAGGGAFAAWLSQALAARRRA
jgi:hypothetical protein